MKDSFLTALHSYDRRLAGGSPSTDTHTAASAHPPRVACYIAEPPLSAHRWRDTLDSNRQSVSMSTDAGEPVGRRPSGFAEVLRGMRVARSLSQEELADRARLTVKAVSALEQGVRRHPYPHTVRSLAEALGLDDDERAALVATLPRRPGTARSAGSADPQTTADTPVPVPAGPVVGRDGDLAAVTRLLHAPVRRVVTLSGPGGVGKTTLALLAAAGSREAFPDGVAVVELADVDGVDMVWPAVAAALRIPDLRRTATVHVVARHLRGRRFLLVLDNLEHLVACGPQLAGLTAQCPELVVLVTSRAPLRIRPEQEVRVAPLGPDAAARLFRERAAAAGAILDDDPDTDAAIAALSHRADGLPLAVELAASAAALFGLAPLLGRLDALPVPAPRDLPDRQSSMDATMVWSDELLTPAARILLRRLAVCAGGFSLAIVDELGDDSGDSEPMSALAELLDQSLVVRLPEVAGSARFRLLVPVREFAARRLRPSDREDALARLTRSLLDTAAGLAEDLHGPEQTVAMRLLDADMGNIRVVVGHLLAGDGSDRAADLMWRLSLYLASRGHVREGISWIDRLSARSGDDLHRARALTASAALRLVAGDLGAARRDAENGFAMAARLGHDELAAEAAVVAATSAIRLQDLDGARVLLDEATGHAGLVERSWVPVHLRLTRAQLIGVSGDGELDAADTAAREAEAAARVLDADYEIAFALNLRALVAQARGHHEESATLLAESVERCVNAADVWLLVHALPAVAGLAVRRGHPDAGARLFGAAASLAADTGVSVSFSLSRRLIREGLDAARDSLGDVAFTTAWEAGRSAVLDEVVALARAVTDVRRTVGPARRS
jgi:predicted ATPase/transcriptional regulator with XRE-family HTH domain